MPLHTLSPIFTCRCCRQFFPCSSLNNGYSYLAAGLLVTAYNITSSFTQPLVGWLSDAKGFSVNISISLLVSAVFIALMGITQNYYLIMLLAIIAALGHACFHPTALSLVNRLCISENRGRITSYFRGRRKFWLCDRTGSHRAPCLLAGASRAPLPHFPGTVHGACPQVPSPGRDCRSMPVPYQAGIHRLEMTSRKNRL